MCLIAYRSNIGSHIPNDVIDLNKTRNPDGFGLAWRVGKDLFYQKFAPNEWDAFRKLLKKVDKMPVVYAAHWRFATQGAKNRDMAHPYEYQERKTGAKNLLFHNGVIDIDSPADKSDTWAFAHRVLPNLGRRWWENSAIKWAIEEAIGWSRLLIMTNDEDILINESSWVTENGIQYSTPPKGYAPKVQTGTYGMYSEGGYWESWNGHGQTGGTKSVETKALASGPLPPKTVAGLSVDETKEALLNAMFDGVDEDEAKIAEGLITHVGHTVSIISQMEDHDNDEKFGTVRCLRCGTTGEYLTIEGKMYIDLKHLAEKI